MTVEAFFDTNVLAYAAVGTGKDEPKRKRAVELIESTNFGTSAQALQEFFVTVVRKASRPLSAAQALEWIEQWTRGHPGGRRRRLERTQSTPKT